MIDQAYKIRIENILKRLGIDSDYERRTGIPMQPEAVDLQEIGLDVFERRQKLAPRAAQQWHAMKVAAETGGIVLQVVSAFRSVDYQVGLIERKLAVGESLSRILAVSAAPGYSEHHTGRALDLTTPGCPHLEEAFEKTPAFQWLCRHGAEFGFTLSYPRDSNTAIVYEPWHWCWAG